MARRILRCLATEGISVNHDNVASRGGVRYTNIIVRYLINMYPRVVAENFGLLADLVWSRVEGVHALPRVLLPGRFPTATYQCFPRLLGFASVVGGCWGFNCVVGSDLRRGIGRRALMSILPFGSTMLFQDIFRMMNGSVGI